MTSELPAHETVTTSSIVYQKNGEGWAEQSKKVDTTEVQRTWRDDSALETTLISSESVYFTEPTETGFYKYVDARTVGVFILVPAYDEKAQWYTVSDSAQMDKCEWGYIEQAVEALGGLVRI